MNTERLKARIHKSTEKTERDVDATAESLANGAEALGLKQSAATRECGDIAQSLRETTKNLSAELEEHVRLHPLATVGLAFAAGLIAARALRR